MVGQKTVYQVIAKPRKLRGHSEYAEKHGREEIRCYTGQPHVATNGMVRNRYEHGVSIRLIEYSAFSSHEWAASECYSIYFLTFSQPLMLFENGFSRIASEVEKTSKIRLNNIHS